jgi:integrase/recombinase XerD
MEIPSDTDISIDDNQDLELEYEFDNNFIEFYKLLAEKIKAPHLQKNTIENLIKISKRLVNDTNLGKLINYLSTTNENNWLKLKQILILLITEKQWKKNTSQNYMSRIKIALNILLPNYSHFINRTISLETKIIDNKKTIFIPNIAKLDEDDETYKFYYFLYTQILIYTKQKSKSSIKKTISVWYNILKELDLNKYNTTDEKINYLKTINKIKIIEIYNNHLKDKHQSKTYKDNEQFIINLLFVTILKIYNENIEFENENEIKDEIDIIDNIDEDGDKHRFTVDEIEALKKNCITTFDNLLFYLLFTTGMRIGGLCNIKIKNIAKYEDNKWTIFEIGRTVEKGRKIRSFPVSHLVIPYLVKWLSEEKILSESPYLFPSKVLINKPLSTNTFRVRFKEICKKANIIGDNAHIHSIRHTVAFMMCEMGNDIDHVSKFLGHSSSKITRDFYVKDTCEENLKKLDVPWFTKDKQEKIIIPNCLMNDSIKEKNYEDKSKYKKKLAKSIQLLAKIS